MDYKNYLFTLKEKKIRKRWLTVTILTYLLISSIILLGGFFTSLVYGNFILSLELLFYTILALFFFYVLYYCAYKKLGTLYLTFCLIVETLHILHGLGSILTFSDSLISTNQYLFLFQIISVIVSIYWCMLSLQLRKMNKKIRLQEKRSIESSEEYKNIIPTIQTASSTEALNRIVSELFEQWPNYKPMISEAYEEKKEALERQPS